MVEIIAHLVFQELYYVLTGKYSVYSHESSQNLDLAGLTLQSKTISIPHEVYCQLKVPHGLQGLKEVNPPNETAVVEV